jgi:hypothetical protein
MNGGERKNRNSCIDIKLIAGESWRKGLRPAMVSTIANELVSSRLRDAPIGPPITAAPRGNGTGIYRKNAV